MPTQNTQLSNGEIYHIVSRAVGESKIFKNTDDYYRGIFSIYEFNNINPVSIIKRRVQRKKEKASRCPTSAKLAGIDRRDKMVEIMAFSLMPNHIHLLLKQIEENGTTEFMRKVGGGYANYFNQKYKRKGHLFNNFKAIHIGTNEQLQNVFTYIHTNRISIIEPGWKKQGIQNSEKVIEFLENDKWHSYPDYLGKKNFSSVTEREFLMDTMGGIEGCREFVNNWVRYKKELKDLNAVALE